LSPEADGAAAGVAAAGAAAFGEPFGAGAVVLCAKAPPANKAVVTATATSVRFIASSFRWNGFVRGIGGDRQSMHRVGDQIADAVENGPMTGQARHPEEVLGHDCHGKVPGATGGAGMTDVLRAVVANFER
jgi:hypothetical protein